MKRPLVVAAVGGVDPTGGAGLARDAATLAHFGVRAATVATALTVQDDRAVHRVEPVEPRLLREQLEAAVAAAGDALAAIKTGLVPTIDHARVVAELATRRGLPLVCDPLLAAGTGDPLHGSDPIDALGPLLEAASLLTPNGEEAARLAERSWDRSVQDLVALARSLSTPSRSVSVTGATADGSESLLAVAGPGGELVEREPRRQGVATHGTGCAFASACAGLLALGHDAKDAARRAHRLVSSWIRAASAPPGGRLVPSPPAGGG